MKATGLFSAAMEEQLARRAPLAARMRPRRLEDVVGQDHILGKDGTLRRSIEAGRVGSMLFSGPPGTGKTTVARLVAEYTGAELVELSAVDSGVAEVRRVIEDAERRLGEQGRATLLFIDEIHRFSKAQQDALLHAVEDGRLVLIGATTENPYFHIIPALQSRCRLHVFRSLSQQDIRRLIDRALAGGFQNEPGGRVEVAEGLRDAMAWWGRGDARRSLNLLELAVALAVDRGLTALDAETLEAITELPVTPFGREADDHYNYISAFIKSLRASDPDAALYYMAVLLEGGEDPLFIARRLVIFASEDVGNAEPRALEVAVAAAKAVEFVGLPEARLNLAQAATFLSCCPKSNASYLGLERAVEEVRARGPLSPPLYLCDPRSVAGRTEQPQEAYLYPHEYGGYVGQPCLPEALRDKVFYEPREQGLEGEFKEFLDGLRRLRGAAE